MTAADRTSPLVVVAPDKFKGSLSAVDAAAALARGLRRGLPGARVVEHPIADGGEGSVEMVLAHGFRPVSREVRGPTGDPVVATYALAGDTALVEMAAAAGLGRLPGGAPDDRTARTASTYGVGELVRDALDRGARRIVLAVGGSATTDGGAGMVAALGARTWTASGEVLPEGGAGLLDVERLDPGGLDPRLAGATVVVACDVDNPLTGPDGAASVYGPQKGTTPEQVDVLDRALVHWADLVARTVGTDHRDDPGAGAAGGVGFALLAVGAHLSPGIDLVLDLVDFDHRLDTTDLVVVGEGRLDEQTLRGKAPAGVAARAVARGIPVVAVCGHRDLDEAGLTSLGARSAHALTDLEPDPAVCIRDAARLLERLAPRLLDPA
ncbi:MAG: glycerate kinase [Ilumatobacteraceae bacterium]